MSSRLFYRFMLILVCYSFLLSKISTYAQTENNGDFDFLFSIDQDTSFYIDVSQREVLTLNAPASVWAAFSSPNGKYVLARLASDGRLCVLAEEWQVISCLPENFSNVSRRIVWEPDNESFWIAGEENQEIDVILHVRISDGAVLTRIDHTQVYASEGSLWYPAYRDLSLTHNLAVSTNRVYIYLLSLQTETITKMMSIDNIVPRGSADNLSFSPDGNTLAMVINCHASECGRQDQLAFYDIESDQLELYEISVNGIRYSVWSDPFWSPDGSTIVFHALEVGSRTSELTDDYATILFGVSTHTFQIVSRDEYDIGVLQWSSSGEYLVKTSCSLYTRCQITIFDLDGNAYEVGIFEPDWDYIGGTWVQADWISETNR